MRDRGAGTTLLPEDALRPGHDTSQHPLRPWRDTSPNVGPGGPPGGGNVGPRRGEEMLGLAEGKQALTEGGNKYLHPIGLDPKPTPIDLDSFLAEATSP